MKRRAFLIFVACAAVGLPFSPCQAQDGFGGTYQQAPPQQWQPIGPQSSPPGYGQQQTPNYQQGAPNYQQQNPYPPPEYTQGAPGQGQYGTPTQQQLYGFATQQAPPQTGPQGPPPPPPQWQQQQNGNYYGGPTGYQGPGSAPPQQPMQHQQKLQEQADNYFNEQNANANSDEQEAPQGDGMLKKGMKALAGVGGAVAAGYLLNKAAQKNPMMRMMGGGPGYGYPGMGYPGMGGPMMPGMGMGYPMMPGGMMPGMGYPMMPGGGMGGGMGGMMPGMGLGF